MRPESTRGKSRDPARSCASHGPPRRYSWVKRLPVVFAPLAVTLVCTATALGEEQPFKTVVDSIVPKTPGLTIEGSTGGCDLVLQSQAGQDVVLFGLSKPPR